MNGHVVGKGSRLLFSGSMRDLASGAQAILDVQVQHPAEPGVSTFGAAERVSLVLDGRRRGRMIALEGCLPGVPDEAVTLELRSVW